MTETQANIEFSGIESKFTRIALIFISMILLFVGPTYIPYFISDTLGGTYFVLSAVVGAVMFIAGLGLLIYLIRKKVIA